MSTGLADVVARLARARDTRVRWQEDHERAMREMDRVIASLEHDRDLLTASSMTTEQVEVARRVVEVDGSISESAEGAFEAALAAVAEGGTRLLRERIGAKRYGGFHQRCDCTYGTGPKHGHVVFSVGLTRDARLRAAPAPDGEPLTISERDAAVAYLLAEKRLSDESMHARQYGSLHGR